MALQVVGLMRLVPANQDDRLAKAALFTKYAELLPAALMSNSANAMLLVSDLLLGIREVIAACKLTHQNLFRCVVPGRYHLSLCRHGEGSDPFSIAIHGLETKCGSIFLAQCNLCANECGIICSKVSEIVTGALLLL